MSLCPEGDFDAWITPYGEPGGPEVNRAMSLGWRRQLLDVMCFALLSNAVVAHRAAGTGLHGMAAAVPINGRRSRRTAAG
jgi:hypothetical protein